MQRQTIPPKLGASWEWHGVPAPLPSGTQALGKISSDEWHFAIAHSRRRWCNCTDLPSATLSLSPPGTPFVLQHQGALSGTFLVEP